MKKDYYIIEFVHTTVESPIFVPAKRKNLFAVIENLLSQGIDYFTVKIVSIVEFEDS